MNEITLKYPAIQAPTEAEKQVVNSGETTVFDAFFMHAESNYELYQNPIERLKAVIRVKDATPTVNDEEMDSIVRKMNHNAVEIHQELANHYEALSNNEKRAFNIINRLESELETRKYFQLAIDEANTSIDYFVCATLADDLYGEQEVVFKLYEKSIKTFQNNSATPNHPLKVYIEGSNLSAEQKVELKIQLQNKVEVTI